MKEIKFLHTADCHITSDSSVFGRIVALCRENDVSLLIISGDLFDSPFPQSAVVREVIGLISQLPDTIVAICSGNHDYACEGSVYEKYEFPRNTVLFLGGIEKTVFPGLGLTLYGAGFTSRHSGESAMADFEADADCGISIGVFHGEITPDGASSFYNPITAAQIAASRLDYLALGHIHKKTPPARLGKTTYCYCGEPRVSGFDSASECGAYLGTISEGGTELFFINITDEKIVSLNVNISGTASSVQAAECCMKEIYGLALPDPELNLYSVTLSGSVSPDFTPNTRYIADILAENGIRCRLTDKTSPDISGIAELAREKSLRGIFTGRLLDKIENSEGADRERYISALKIGLCAFSGEVSPDED